MTQVGRALPAQAAGRRGGAAQAGRRARLLHLQRRPRCDRGLHSPLCLSPSSCTGRLACPSTLCRRWSELMPPSCYTMPYRNRNDSILGAWIPRQMPGSGISARCGCVKPIVHDVGRTALCRAHERSHMKRNSLRRACSRERGERAIRAGQAPEPATGRSDAARRRAGRGRPMRAGAAAAPERYAVKPTFR